MREIKFRAWQRGRMLTQPIASTYGASRFLGYLDLDVEIMQSIGIMDSNNKDFYIGDIAVFENGDIFVLRLEDWLEVYVDWIGDPECEDQARDLYRISNALIIGNAHQNPELLKENEND